MLPLKHKCCDLLFACPPLTSTPTAPGKTWTHVTNVLKLLKAKLSSLLFHGRKRAGAVCSWTAVKGEDCTVTLLKKATDGSWINLLISPFHLNLLFCILVQLVHSHLPFQGRSFTEELYPSPAAEGPVTIIWQRHRYGTEEKSCGLTNPRQELRSFCVCVCASVFNVYLLLFKIMLIKILYINKKKWLYRACILSSLPDNSQSIFINQSLLAVWS